LKIGKLLYAEPTLNNDINFNRSVVLLVEENKLGTVGFILNKKTVYSTLDLVPELNQNFIIYNGGPVEKDNLYFIHNIPELINNSIKITDTLYWGGDFSSVVRLINEKKIDKSQIKFFLGYSGWNSNQLNEEIEEKAWIIDNANEIENLALNTKKNIWKNKLISLGGEYLIWSSSPENPQHN
jgi:putative transcriptional regulator